MGSGGMGILPLRLCLPGQTRAPIHHGAREGHEGQPSQRASRNLKRLVEKHVDWNGLAGDAGSLVLELHHGSAAVFVELQPKRVLIR